MRRLGSGRQGVVNEILQQGHRQCRTTHALKIFDPSIYRNEACYWQDMDRLSAQVTILHNARSPFLVHCDNFQETNGIGSIQMEKVDGLTLSSLIKSYERCSASNREVLFNRSLSNICLQPGVVIYLMRQILSGLETLHKAGYLHCDLKPSNVMVDPLGYVRVIDLGRAQPILGESEQVIATPLYSAPELHVGESISIQSDIYSVGLIGLELMLGRPLLPKGTRTKQRLFDSKKELPEILDMVLPPYIGCNREFVDILKRFLAVDPSERFVNAATAETDKGGLATVHKQLAKMNIDSDYRRELSTCVRAYNQRGF